VLQGIYIPIVVYYSKATSHNKIIIIFYFHDSKVSTESPDSPIKPTFFLSLKPTRQFSMGAAVSAVRDQIDKIDDAKGKEAEVKEALENMRQAAQDQLNAFNERIRYAWSSSLSCGTLIIPG
jgi:hypothetical protein